MRKLLKLPLQLVTIVAVVVGLVCLTPVFLYRDYARCVARRRKAEMLHGESMAFRYKVAEFWTWAKAKCGWQS